MEKVLTTPIRAAYLLTSAKLASGLLGNQPQEIKTMKKLKTAIFGLAAMVFAGSVQAQIVWNMNTDTPSSNSFSEVTIGSMTQYNNNGTTTLLTTTSASSGYTGSSGTNNAGAAARVGTLNTASGGSVAFVWTLTVSSGYEFSLTDVSFGSRSTGTGPVAFSLQYSTDGFATAGTEIGTGTLTANSTWALSTPSVTDTVFSEGLTYTFRLYGYGGAGSPTAGTANWRIDDMSFIGSVSAVPEPGTYALLLLGGSALVACRRFAVRKKA